MRVIDIDTLKPPSGGSPRFEGVHHGANVSFFVVGSAPGNGADRHRHPYEEVFVILEGSIEGQIQMLEAGSIAVIPAHRWHEFKNRGDRPALMVNIHPVPQMIQEDWTAASEKEPRA